MNIKALVIASFVLMPLTGYMQVTVILQPGPANGKDAVVWSNGADNNNGAQESLTAYTWTNQGLLGIKRFFVEFDLSVIPQDAFITEAALSLFYNPTDPHESVDVHSGMNEFVIQRVIEPWEELTVTWNNQPNVTTRNQAYVPSTSSPTQDYLDLDVTVLIRKMHDPAVGNYGLSVRMIDEQNPYRMIILASSDHTNAQLRPKLTITYITPQKPYECLTIQPVADAMVWNNSPNANYGALPNLNVYTWTNQGILGIKRAYLDFDFSAIPNGIDVIDVRMSIFFNASDEIESIDFHSGSNEMYIQRVVQPWDESSITWNNKPASVSENQVSLPRFISNSQDYNDIDITKLIYDVFEHPQQSHGFVIRMENESMPFRMSILASSDHPDPSVHPELTICWIQRDPDEPEEPDCDDFHNTLLSVHPNPNNGTFQTNIPLVGLGPSDILLYDIWGRHAEFTINHSSNSITIHNPNTGFYFLTISNPLCGKQHTRFVVRNYN